MKQAINNLSFNYIVFGSLDIVGSEYMHIMYNDLQGYDNIKFIDSPFYNHSHYSLYSSLHKFHFHGVINKYLYLPLKSLWNEFYYNEQNEDPHNICFLFFMSELTLYHESFFKYLKNRYPGCKMVVYFEDLVASRPSVGKNAIRLDYIEKYFDLSISYDKGDCMKYGFLYYPTSYSVVKIQNNPTINDSDLFFCGAAKQRYNIISNIFSKCLENNVICDFMVARYEGYNKVKGIEYIDYMISYKDYLEHMIKSNCLLDVIQSGSTGFTVRVWEALVYGKKLLTNNKKILNAPFYDEKQFCYFESIGDREIEFILNKVEIEPRCVEELSPMRLLEFIDNNLLKA